MNDFIIKLQAMIDQSSLTNLQKKLLKQKLNIPVKVDTAASEQSIHNLANSILAFQQNNTKMSRSTKRELDSMYNSLINGTSLSKKEITDLKTRFTQLKVQVRDAGQLGKSFADSIRQGMGSFASWLPASQIVVRMVQSVTSAVRELKSLDDILTEISKTSDLTNKQLEKLGNNAFEAASKYGRTASDYLTGVQEMYRAGFDNAEEMAELSILAQAAGDMEITSANDYLMATNAAYNYKGSIEALNGVLDSQNYITNNAAVSMQDMADATTEAASVASQYGVQIDELSAMIATVASKTRESGSEVGTALRSIFVTLQDTTSKPVVEAFESVNISMTKFEDGVEKLKTPIELLKELSVAFNELPEGALERSQILTDIGKKYHANTLAAVLGDWSAYEEMLELYANGMGSAAREAEKSANNWSGSWNKVKNSWTDLIQNFADTDVIIGAINVLNSLIIGLDKLGVVGTGLLGAGIFAGAKNAGVFKTWLSDLTKIQGVVNNIGKIDLFVNDSNLLNSNTVKALSASINGLNVQQAQLALSTKNLTNEQTKQVLVHAGLIASEDRIQSELVESALQRSALSAETQKAILVELGLMNAKNNELLIEKACTKAELENILATKGITGANAEAIISTLGLSTATSTTTISFNLLTASIWNSVKAMWTFLTTTPLGWFTLIAGGIALVAGAISKFTTSIEEASEATKDAIGELSSISTEVETLEGKLADLRTQIDGLNPITDAEDIKNLEAETSELENQLAILKEKQRIASEEADKKAQESLGKTQTSKYEVVEGQSQVVNGYVQETGGAYAEVTREEELRNAMEAYDEYYQQRLALEAELAKMSADDKSYKDKENQINLLNQQMTDARSHASELALALDEEKDGLNGTTTESKALLNSTNATLTSYSQWLNGINNTTDALDKNANAINGVTASATKFTKSEMISAINSMSDGFEALDKIYADVLDGGTFDFSNLDTKKFEEQFAGLENEYTKFIETVSASPTDIDACQNAFDELTDAYIRQKDILDGLSQENAQLTIDMLENMGVVNAEEVVMSALGATFADYATAKRECASAGVDLINATNEEIIALINEDKVSRATANGLFLYQVQKALSNENGIDTIEDCTQLENLALAAGYTGSALLYLGQIKALLNKIDNDKLDSDSLGYKSVMGQVKNYNSLLQQVLATEKKTTISMSQYGGAAKTAAAANDKLKDAANAANDALKKQKEALQATKEKLEDQKKEYDELYDAIQWFYDEQLEDLDDEIEGLERVNELLEKQRDNLDDVMEAMKSVYQDEIDLLQEKADALDKANEKSEIELRLEEAKRKLLEAKSRKTKLIYQKGVGFTYQTDSKAISDAESELEEANADKVKQGIQDQIDVYQSYIDKLDEIPDAYEKAMQRIAASKYLGKDWATAILNPSDDLFANLESDYTGIESSISKNESKIDSIEKEKKRIQDLKELWEDAKNAYRDSQYQMKLESFFGSDYEYQLLNNSASWRRQFANEYSSICAEIASVESQIKNLSEETASSVESSAERMSNSAKNVKDSFENTGSVSKYLWTDEDTNALEYARQRLDALNQLIGQGKTELQGAADKVQNFVDNYSQLEQKREVTDDLKTSVQELGDVYSATDDYLGQMASGVSDRLEDSKNYTQELVANTQTTAEQLGQVNEQINALKTSEDTVETETDKAVSNVDTTISNLLNKLDELKLKLSEIKLSRDEVETITDEELVDTSTIVDGVHTKVSEIQSAMSLLTESITPLQGALDGLLERMTLLDEVTLSNVIGAFGGASGSGNSESGGSSKGSGKSGKGEGESGGGTGLLAAIEAVSEAIGSSGGDGGEGSGLLSLLDQVNNAPLDTIIGEFGLGEGGGDGEGSLLNAVNAVSTAINGGEDGGEGSLVSSIEQLGSDNTVSNVEKVTTSFGELLGLISSCITKVEELSSAIAAIPPVSGGGSGGGGVGGFAKGGIITKKATGDFDYIAHAVGEDHTVAVKEGEAIIPKASVDANKALVSALISGNGDVLEPYDPYPNIDYTQLMAPMDFQPKWDFAKSLLNDRVERVAQQTVIQINGNLSFPNIKSGDDAEKLIYELSTLSSKALQRSTQRR